MILSYILFGLAGVLTIVLFICLAKILPGHFTAMECIRSDHRLGICDYCKDREAREQQR